MLAPLDNETIFKKAFTDKEVFQQFVKDLFGIDIVVDKIETEKSLSHHYPQLTLNWIFMQRVPIIRLLSRFKRSIMTIILTGFCITS